MISDKNCSAKATKKLLDLQDSNFLNRELDNEESVEDVMKGDFQNNSLDQFDELIEQQEKIDQDRKANKVHYKTYRVKV